MKGYESSGRDVSQLRPPPSSMTKSQLREMVVEAVAMAAREAELADRLAAAMRSFRVEAAGGYSVETKDWFGALAAYEEARGR